MNANERIIARARAVIARMEAYGEHRGIPLGNGPFVRAARQVIANAERRIADAAAADAAAKAAAADASAKAAADAAAIQRVIDIREGRL